MARQAKSKPVVQSATGLVFDQKDVRVIDMSNMSASTFEKVVQHDKKILNLMLQLCDGVQALNGSIYPWKQIREDIVSLMEK